MKEEERLVIFMQLSVSKPKEFFFLNQTLVYRNYGSDYMWHILTLQIDFWEENALMNLIKTSG